MIIACMETGVLVDGNKDRIEVSKELSSNIK